MSVRFELDWAYLDDEDIETTIRILAEVGIMVHRVAVSEHMDAFCVDLPYPAEDILKIHNVLSEYLGGHPAFPETVGLVLEPSEFKGIMGTSLCLTVYNGYLE